MPAAPKLKQEMEACADRFVAILNREEYRSDEICRRIGADRALATDVGRMLWSYVEKDFTKGLNEERRAKIGPYWQQVVGARDGFEKGMALWRVRYPDRAALLAQWAQELRAEEQGAETLMDTKRHGRERDHGILYSIRQVLEKRVGPVTNVTLANLVNAGLEASGQAEADKPVTEDDIRKNLRNFLDRNPAWNATGNKDPRK
jgi:hypothetical protein